MRVDAEHLVGEHLGGERVEEHPRAVALDDLVALFGAFGLVEADLDVAVDLLGGDAERADVGERRGCVVVDLEHRASLCGMRILIAEDETIIRLDLRDLLERAGHEVVAEARDGEEAVPLAREHEPELAVHGREDAAARRDRGARTILDERPIPIVMLTAYGQDELVGRAVEAGVFGYLVKPFREQDLVPAIADGPRTARRAAGGARGGRVARRRARRAQGDRAREGPADGEGRPDRGRRLRPAPQREPGLGPAAARDRGGRDRYIRARDDRRRSRHRGSAPPRRPDPAPATPGG